ncbi:hypothetical protein HPB48_017471 [Haemaphysalis longicornis]|uniref:Reverse transcriptase domain-containing protein n=1 Tax=Haemaphysalis longicornis TaxID=44386 RepID=A0A9J6FFX7_HAELO|nr:hypothetical protein HPB48_017471 [Haemaphysalis longicornis]
MIKFAENNNVFTPLQHRFLKGFWTTTQLVSSGNALLSSLDKSGQTDIILLDISKAFYWVSRCGLILKPKKSKFPYKMVKKISYLNLRHQFLDIAGNYSHGLSVNSGALQGSVLAP